MNTWWAPGPSQLTTLWLYKKSRDYLMRKHDYFLSFHTWGSLEMLSSWSMAYHYSKEWKSKLHDHHPNPKCWTINTWLLLSIFLGWLHLHPSAPTLNLLSHCISFSSRISFSSVTPTSEHTHVTFYGMNHLWALSSPARNLPKDRDLYQFCSLIYSEYLRRAWNLVGAHDYWMNAGMMMNWSMTQGKGFHTMAQNPTRVSEIE